MGLDQGLIDNVTHPVVEFFPELVIANMTPWKENITIEHLLTYTSGLYWDEKSTPYGDPDNSYTQMQSSEDWAGYVLNQTVLYEPGTHWNYGGGDSHLLSCIFTKETGMSLHDFAVETLFSSLNITYIAWGNERTGLSNGANGLRMTPHDLAKMGFLILNNGTWDSEQVVSKEWIQNSWMPKIRIAEEFEFDHVTQFGRHWYMHESYDSYFITPLSSTRDIFVLPKYDLVVVMSKGLTSPPYYQDELLYDFILSSMESTSEPTNTHSVPSSSTTSAVTTTESTTLPTPLDVDIVLISVAAAVIAIPVIIVIVYKRGRTG
jgi:CubicO group peptidase (beta-lactamase class C family)